MAMHEQEIANTIHVCVNMNDAPGAILRIVKSYSYISYIDVTLTEEAEFRHIQELRDQGMYVHLLFVLPDGNAISEDQMAGLKRAYPLCHKISFYDNKVNLIASYYITNEA